MISGLLLTVICGVGVILFCACNLGRPLSMIGWWVTIGVSKEHRKSIWDWDFDFLGDVGGSMLKI